MANSTQIYENSLTSLDRIRLLLSETKETANNTIEQLALDREKLEKVNEKVKTINNNMSLSRKILNKINNHNKKQKCIVGTGAGIILAGAITTLILSKKI